MLAGIDRNWSRDAPTQPPASPVLLYNMGHAEEQVRCGMQWLGCLSGLYMWDVGMQPSGAVAGKLARIALPIADGNSQGNRRLTVGWKTQASPGQGPGQE